MFRNCAFTLTAVFIAATPVMAQEAVRPAANIEALFTDPDPVLNTNKQVAYFIEKDLLQGGQWEDAGKYLTDRYIQHNPNAASGLKGVVEFFLRMRKAAPGPVPPKLTVPVVSVVAQGDLVIVTSARTLPDPKESGKTYTTTWFDMWRIKDGKADEHWDPATKNP